MIILPDRNIPRARFLMPVQSSEWREPSRAMWKDQFGNTGVRTCFRIRARLNDGHVKWTGWFDDRNDFDAFLWAIATDTLRHERPLWKLPNVEWHLGIGNDVTYDFLTQTILTTTGSNQTYTSPSDWDNNSNQIECLGAGASGGANDAAAGHATGGGAGAYSAITNFSFASPGTTTATYRVGAGGASVSINSSGHISGNSGEATWWNDTVNPGNGTDNTKCSAAGGANGVSGTGSRNGGNGGAASASWGQTKYSGGRGGNLTGASGNGGSGGGGAAGPAGNGGNGEDSSSTSDVDSDGGSANNGTTAGGTGGSPSTDGSSGTEFSPSYGCGSGGAGWSTGSSGGTVTGRAPGNYGGASGGGKNTSSGTAASAAGSQGLIVVEYTPFIPAAKSNNMPMLGM